MTPGTPIPPIRAPQIALPSGNPREEIIIRAPNSLLRMLSGTSRWTRLRSNTEYGPQAKAARPSRMAATARSDARHSRANNGPPATMTAPMRSDGGSRPARVAPATTPSRAPAPAADIRMPYPAAPACRKLRQYTGYKTVATPSRKSIPKPQKLSTRTAGNLNKMVRPSTFRLAGSAFPVAARDAGPSAGRPTQITDMTAKLAASQSNANGAPSVATIAPATAGPTM